MSGANVVVVTDTVWIENDVRASLTDSGTILNRINDPRRAVEGIKEFNADVAVIDMQVGSKGGMAVVRSIRAATGNEEIGPVRTVVLLDRSADEFLARRAGADAWVLKPFDAQDLRAAVAPAPV